VTTDHAAIGRKAKCMGKGAEAVVAGRLRALGLLCVERIETGFRLRRAPGRPGQPSRIVGAAPMGRVMGDFKAVVPGGRAVLVEVKWRPERLGWADLGDHQRAALDAYHAAGALALLAWVHEAGLAVMRWPLPVTVFRKGLTLTPQNAAILNLDYITTTARKEGHQ
jgi:hypothetical protein